MLVCISKTCTVLHDFHLGTQFVKKKRCGSEMVLFLIFVKTL